MTMTNAEWCIKNGYKFSDLDADYINQGNGCRITINGEKIGIIPLVNRDRAIFLWLDQEHKEPILDDVERKYLTAVIRPFRGRVKYICKIESRFRMGMQFIKISTGDNYCDDSITFPLFASGTMYRGMKANKDYTPEELGL